ncbi:MAG: fibrobacter succinogenes major paralogous domain-containing protein [Mediterranea sp.]|nr:fibrobacter succinogenes major paralogous domain-containing protein [Mediterranea sp.]
MVTLYPASGFRNAASGTFTSTGSYRDWWSCALTGANAYYLFFDLSRVHPSNSTARAYGLSVRCVQHLLLLRCILIAFSVVSGFSMHCVRK